MINRRLFPALLLVVGFACTPEQGRPAANPTRSVSPSHSPSSASASPTTSPAPPLGEDPETIYDTSGQDPGCVRPQDQVVAPIEGTPLDDQVTTIARAVELLRDLDFDRPPRSRLLTEDAFVAKSRALVGQGYAPEQAKLDEKILTHLGLLPPAADLLDLSKEVAGEQIGGFYLPKDKTLYVPRGGENLSPYDEIVVSHELEHALADSAIGLPKLESDNLRRADRLTAERALIEGDASLLMQQYGAAAFTPEDAAELLADPALTQSIEEAEDVPFVLQRSLEFSYEEGLRFACRLYLEGEWRAIDRAYDRPPASTAQILLPGFYDRRVEPVPAPPLADPGDPWNKAATSSFGMFDLTILLQAPGGESVMSAEESLEQAREWRGGTMTAWESGKKIALGISIATAARGDGPALCGHLERWAQESFDTQERARGEFQSRGRYTIVDCAPEGVRLAMAPTKADATRLLP